MSIPSARAELAVGAVLLGIAIAIFVQTLGAPAPEFDPLGPAALPRALSVLIGAMSAALMIKAALASGNEQTRQPESEAAATKIGSRGNYTPLLVICLASFVYAGVLSLRLAPYWLVTWVFTAVAVATMSGFAWRSLPKAIAAGAVLGIGCHLLFTRIFIIDLP